MNMKYLSHYTQEAQTKLFNDLGVFFAFSNSQLEEKRVEGIEYCTLGSGLIVPVGNEQAVIDGMEIIHRNAIAKDIEENGKAQIIRRELFNHECFYDGDVNRCFEALEDYGFTKLDIIEAYKHIRETEEVD